ncbi:cation diffusion facilitator family transporter [Piscinibacter terrae]|uniref:Cation diffusion facilitator family transporter n=1 Tax=Piscinibacter terrae TaxID=2496871 RepID=A0A3N7HJ80_9BURK|nr:cation diffusion facilitator family transporter [Albitalea terrae]RQP22110.1 cation diffusion facilitator family transporter [Albitalea terrae]
MSAQADSLKSILFALGANFAIAVAKTAGAVFTGSSSMLAEAIHSYADCGNQALLIWGLKEAKSAPTADHPLGFGKAIYFWSFIVALMLFSMGGLFSIYEGVHKLHDTEPVKYAWVAVGILAFSIAAEGMSLWGCLGEIKKDRGEQSLWQWFKTSRQSELLVVLGEDLAALGGLVLAFGFILLSILTGNPMWDAVGSIAIGVLLVVVAVLVGVEVKALLVGQSATPQRIAQMRAHLEAQPEVNKVFNLLTQQLGGEIMLAVKAQMAPQPSDVALVEAINRVEKGLREHFPDVRWIFFEPDLRD